MADRKKHDIPGQGDIFGDPVPAQDEEMPPETITADDDSASYGEQASDGGKKEKKGRKDKKDETFEKLLERLEVIVETMESGGLPLDEMMKLYEEGVRKAESLTSMLAAARTRVMKLVENADGEPSLEHFD